MKVFLKILGKLYFYTGIYLGKYFEDKYINDNEVYFCFDWCIDNLGMNFDDYLSLQRGIWQANHGFVRRFKSHLGRKI